MRSLILAMLLLFTISLVGCGGSGETMMPEGPLTDEQKAEINAADTAVDDEEQPEGY